MSLIGIDESSIYYLFQLKEEIEAKEAALTNVNKEQAVMVKEKEELSSEVDKGIQASDWWKKSLTYKLRYLFKGWKKKVQDIGSPSILCLKF